MTTPAPYPADTRAKGWRFELDLERIRQSDTWALAPADLRPWLFLLWATAWEQVPCGSLPHDDSLIAARIGMNEKAFAKGKAVLMRGWWPADDGRLYHDVIASRVLAMLHAKEKDKTRKAEYRARMDAERARLAAAVQQPSANVPRDNQGTPLDSASRDDTGTGTGTGTVEETQNPSGSSSAERTATPTIPCPYQAIVGLYHERLPGLPKVRLMPKGRQTALRKVWGWVLSSTKSDGARRATNADEALQWLDGYFARAAENDFLMGRVPRGAEHANWQCDLDFLLTDRGMKQVIEKTLEAAA